MFAIKFCVHSLAEQGISVNAEQLLKVENAVKVDALEKMAGKKKGLSLDSPPQYLSIFNYYLLFFLYEY